MIKIENVEVHGFQPAIRGMRNPMNSWERSDSEFYDIADYLERLFHKGPGTSESIPAFVIGPNDHSLMIRLAKTGSEHAKYRRMIVVYMDVTAPLYWWAEADTYKVGTVRNSCSKMHKIHSKEFTMDDFSHEHLTYYDHDGELCRDFKEELESLVDELNCARELFNETGDKKWWWQMIQLLPSSYNQRATLMLNYETLANIYHQRKNHKLDEWREFCQWIKTLPYSEIITNEQ